MSRFARILTQGELLKAVSKDEYRLIEFPKDDKPPFKGGERFVVTRHGGLLIGAFPDSGMDTPNSIYTSDDFLEAFGKKGHPVIGGGRLTIAPEFGSPECGGATYHLKEPGNYDTWEPQSAINPGDYSFQEDLQNSFTLADRDVTLTDFNSGDDNLFQLFRTYGKRNGRINHESVRVARVGVMSTISCHVTQNYQAWELMQLPAGTKERPGTVILPYSQIENEDRTGIMAAYMKYGDGSIFSDAVIGDDHVSIKTMQPQDSRMKLAITPGHGKLTRAKENMVMHITDYPGRDDWSQLVVMEARGVPNNVCDIMEIPSIGKEQTESMPPCFRGERGAIFMYNGASEKDGSSFVELEVLGNAPKHGYSTIVNNITFYWGPSEEIVTLARMYGNLSGVPHVYGVNDLSRCVQTCSSTPAFPINLTK